MDMERMRDLLAEWGWWAIGEGTQHRAKTTSSMAERIGGDSYGSDHVPDVDLDVLRVDALIKRLPRLLINALSLAYKDPRPLKKKLPATVTRNAHNERVRTAQIALVDMWDEDKTIGKKAGNKTFATMGLD